MNISLGKDAEGYFIYNFKLSITMDALQLEFPSIGRSQEVLSLACLQAWVESNEVSMGKMRRRLFAEVGELKKENLEMKQELEHLKKKMREITGEQQQWVYKQEEFLFLAKG